MADGTRVLRIENGEAILNCFSKKELVEYAAELGIPRGKTKLGSIRSIVNCDDARVTVSLGK